MKLLFFTDYTPNKSKRAKFSHTDSGFDDQERYEKKRYCAMQFQQYLNRGGPKNHGCKELPKVLYYYYLYMTWNYYFQDSVELIEEYKSNYINILVIQCVTIVY